MLLRTFGDEALRQPFWARKETKVFHFLRCFGRHRAYTNEKHCLVARYRCRFEFSLHICCAHIAIRCLLFVLRVFRVLRWAPFRFFPSIFSTFRLFACRCDLTRRDATRRDSIFDATHRSHKVSGAPTASDQRISLNKRNIAVQFSNA